MDREMASTAPISQPLQYMMVTTRQTMPAGAGRQGGGWHLVLPHGPRGVLGDTQKALGNAGGQSRVEPPPPAAGGSGPDLWGTVLRMTVTEAAPCRGQGAAGRPSLRRWDSEGLGGSC